MMLVGIDICLRPVYQSTALKWLSQYYHHSISKPSIICLLWSGALMDFQACFVHLLVRASKNLAIIICQLRALDFYLSVRVTAWPSQSKAYYLPASQSTEVLSVSKGYSLAIVRAKQSTGFPSLIIYVCQLQLEQACYQLVRAQILYIYGQGNFAFCSSCSCY